MPPREKKVAAKQPKKQFTVEDLLAKATECYEDGKFELSSKFYVSALTKEPENTQIMDALADVYMQMGDVDNATQLLKKSTDMAPLDNPYKWMFLGQLQSCTEAVDSYRKGIEILSFGLQNPEFENLHSDYRKQIAKAHCSIVNIYMTDLCDEEDAEAVCDTAVQAAITIDPTGIDGLMTQVDLRMTQAGLKTESESRQLKLKAAETLQELFVKIKSVTDVIQQTSLGHRSEETELRLQEAESAMPDFDAIVRVVQLMIECGVDAQVQQPALVEGATELLTALLEFSDDEVELWELKATSFLKHTPADTEGARECYETALRLLDEERNVCENSGRPFQGKADYKRIKGLLKKLDEESNDPNAAAGVVMNEEVLEDVNEDEEWSDVEEEGEQMEEGN